MGWTQKKKAKKHYGKPDSGLGGNDSDEENDEEKAPDVSDILAKAKSALGSIKKDKTFVEQQKKEQNRRESSWDRCGC